MSIDETSQNRSQSDPHTSDAWREVGDQFRLLGRSLAAAIRASWRSEETQRRLQALRTSVESMASEVAQAAKEAVPVPQAQQVRETAQRAAETALTVSSEALEEARPHIVAALQHANSALQLLIERLEANPQGSPPSERIPVEAPCEPQPPTTAEAVISQALAAAARGTMADAALASAGPTPTDATAPVEEPAPPSEAAGETSKAEQPHVQPDEKRPARWQFWRR